MNKHLPGQHNQLAHGRLGSPNRAGFQRSLTKAGIISSFNTNNELLLNSGTIGATLLTANTTGKNPRHIIVVKEVVIDGSTKSTGPYPFKKLVTDYTRMTAQNIADYTDTILAIENAARNNDIFEVWLPPAAMPVTYAAKRGYALHGLSVKDEDELAKAAAAYLEDNYGFKVPVYPAEELTMYNAGNAQDGYEIQAKTLVKLKHPTAGVPLYLEYLMHNTWRPDNPNIVYTKNLDE